jgi:hypothetical protein
LRCLIPAETVYFMSSSFGKYQRHQLKLLLPARNRRPDEDRCRHAKE